MKYIDIKKILYMDLLIRRRGTGNSDKFAEKLGLSRSTFFEYLGYMRCELELCILYNKYKETYYYDGTDLPSLLHTKYGWTSHNNP